MTDDVSEVAVDAAVSAVQADQAEQINEVTLSNGVRISSRPVPPLLLTRAGVEVPKPQVPMTFLEEKGRDEPNPDDPAYVAAVQKYRMDLGEAATNVALIVGTKIEHVPDSLHRPEDNEWLDELEAVGLRPKVDTEPARKLAWFRYYALATTEDLNTLLNFVGGRAGVREGDVTKVAESFPGGEGRGADPGLPVETRDPDGDPVHANGSGPGSGDRGTGDR